MIKSELVKYLKPFGQEHLATFWDELNENERDQLLGDIKQTDFAELNSYFARVQAELAEGNVAIREADLEMIPVADEIKGSYAKSSAAKLKQYENEGLRAIADNQVAVLLLAGGQGTRLGFNYPKGMYSVDLLSNKTLYQLQAERLVKLKQLAKSRFPENAADSSSIPWYIMTSEHTQEATREFFASNSYFGLDKENVMLFDQYMLPCLTNEGKAILDEKYKLSKAPEGNGGLYRALLKRGMLDDMLSRGVKYVHVYCVDNILVKMADPIFVGFCLAKGANCAAKVVKKIEPEEKVGVICQVGEKYQVVEYTEISNLNRNLRDENSDLVFNAGNICNHFFSTQFLNDVCRTYENELKHHIAIKKIPYVNENGIRVSPKETNGIKLEKLIFDVFQFSRNFAVWEVPREEEFSPLKNSDDCKKETPTTCRNDLYAQHVRWLKNAGANFASQKQLECEISPLVSCNGEDLSELVAGKQLKTPLRIELDKSNSKVTFNGLDIETYEKSCC